MKLIGLNKLYITEWQRNLEKNNLQSELLSYVTPQHVKSLHELIRANISSDAIRSIFLWAYWVALIDPGLLPESLYSEDGKTALINEINNCVLRNILDDLPMMLVTMQRVYGFSLLQLHITDDVISTLVQNHHARFSNGRPTLTESLRTAVDILCMVPVPTFTNVVPNDYWLSLAADTLFLEADNYEVFSDALERLTLLRIAAPEYYWKSTWSDYVYIHWREFIAKFASELKDESRIWGLIAMLKVLLCDEVVIYPWETRFEEKIADSTSLPLDVQIYT